MDIDRIYEALTSPSPPENLKRAGRPFASASALALLIKIEGVPLMGLSYSAEELDSRFPKDNVPPCARSIFKEELSRYRAWRRTLFDLFLLETGTLADQEPVAGLMRIARLEFDENKSRRLSILRRVLRDGMQVSDLTNAHALQIDRQLCGSMRLRVRVALSLLDQLQRAPLAAASGHLLPAEIIGRLPAPSGHLYHAPLPPRLQAAYADAPTLPKAAMPFVYRLSLMTGIVSSEQDLSLDELAWKCRALWEVDPADHGFQRPSQVALRMYIRHVGQYSGQGYIAPKPKQPTVAATWADLRQLMRSHGKETMTSRTSAVSRYAMQDSLVPAAITPEWVRETARSLKGWQRNAFRSGIFVLDDLIEDASFPDNLLPRQVSGMARERRQAKT